MAPAADWPQWRGPNRDGKSAETGLLAQWPDGGPRLVWKVQGLGEGYSSFAVVGNRLYTQGQRARRSSSSRSTSLPANRSGRRPPATPWAMTKATVLAAHQQWTATASTRWPATARWCAWRRRPASAFGGPTFVADFKGRTPHWGYAESPLVDGDKRDRHARRTRAHPS